jgi:DNA-binding transcriptional regulator YdaS (Cro superfamily)
MFGFTQNAMRAQIAALGAKPTGAVKQVAADQAYAISKFGTSQMGTIRKNFIGARAGAVESAVKMSAGADQLKKGARTIEDIALIFKQSEAQQAAAFAYAKAQQFQEQNNASDEAAAAVAQAAFEQKMAWQMWKKQQDYTAALMAKPEMEAARTQALGIAEDMPMVAAAVKGAIEANRTADGVDWEAVGTDLEAKGFDENSAAVAGTMVQRLQNGLDGTVGDAMVSAQDKMFSAYPGYSQWGERIAATSLAGYTSAVATKNYGDVDPDSLTVPGPTPRTGAAYGMAGSSPAAGEAFWSSFRKEHPELYS